MDEWNKLSEINQIAINTVQCHLYMESKKANFMEIENRMLVARGGKGVGNGWDMSEIWTFTCKGISSEDLIYSMVTIFNNKVYIIYLKVGKSNHTHLTTYIK